MKLIHILLAGSAMLIGSAPAQAQAVHGQGTWESTLLGRDINLHEVAATDSSAVYLYDTTLQVTWLRNANANGVQTWANATTWAANLTTGSGGNTITDWRLPTMAANPDTLHTFNGSTALGYNVPGSSSEMASLFFNTLGNTSQYNTSGVAQAGFGLTNAGSFQNMRSDVYWLGTEYVPNPNFAWLFGAYDGAQTALHQDGQYYALAVRSGDVMAPVPEPETYAMLLAGLGVIGAVARRRRAADALKAEPSELSLRS